MNEQPSESWKDSDTVETVTHSTTPRKYPNILSNTEVRSSNFFGMLYLLNLRDYIRKTRLASGAISLLVDAHFRI